MVQTRSSQTSPDSQEEDHYTDTDSLPDSLPEDPDRTLRSAKALQTRLERFLHPSSPTDDGPCAAPPPPVLGKRPSPFPPSPSPTKRPHRQSSRYAPPSKYAHLPPLTDVLEPNLICVFVGTNPGVQTARSGHAYAHPSNLFWRLLHSSGCTGERLRPERDRDLPRLYSMGNTNIVARPSKDASELSREEMAAGTPGLEAKVREFRPEAVCLVGKGIWEAVWRWRYGRALKKGEFEYGWQGEGERMGKGQGWKGARVFVATSTSGLSASTSPAEKEEIWRPFGVWVRERREEREREEREREENEREDRLEEERSDGDGKEDGEKEKEEK